MASTPFKLKSGNTTSFKTMGSSPAKHPLERTHTHPEEKKEEGPVKGPEDSDVMNIIKKRKQSGPQNSEENKQKEIDKLVEKRDKTAGKGKSVAKPGKGGRDLPQQSQPMEEEEKPQIPDENKSAIDKIKDKGKDFLKDLLRERTPEEKRQQERRRRNRKKRDKLPTDHLKDVIDPLNPFRNW